MNENNSNPRDPAATFEAGFEAVEQAANRSAETLKKLQSSIKALQKASALGEIENLLKSSERSAVLAASLTFEIGEARAAWPFTPEGEAAYLRTSYERELLAQADRIGIPLRALDGKLVSFPVILRILPESRSARLDRTKTAVLRPSALIERLKKQTAKKPRLQSEKFLEVLQRSYRLLAGSERAGATVPLVQIHEVLTLLPGVARDYGLPEFLRDIYLLETQGVSRTKSGHKAVLIAPSSASREGKGLVFFTETGEERPYYGIRFMEVNHDSDNQV